MKEVSIEKKTLYISYGTIVVILIFLLTITAQFSKWKENVDNKYSIIDKKTTDLEESEKIIKEQIHESQNDILLLTSNFENINKKLIYIDKTLDQMCDKANKRDLELVEIKTKLANIETLLVEIKKDMREN